MSHDNHVQQMEALPADDTHANHDHSSVDSGMNMGNGSMHHMMMYFHFGDEETILFKEWTTNSWQSLFGSCVIVFLIAALYEGLKVFREVLLKRSVARARYNNVSLRDQDNNGNGNGTSSQAYSRHSESVRSRMLTCAHIIQTLLHVLQVIISYSLMLVFMTYNVWLCLAVALGAGIGYFVFGWKRAVVVDINEHCH